MYDASSAILRICRGKTSSDGQGYVREQVCRRQDRRLDIQMQTVARVNEVAGINVRVNCNIWRQSVHRQTLDSLWSMEVVPVTSGRPSALLYGGPQVLLCARAVQGLQGTGKEQSIHVKPQHDVTDDQLCRHRTISVSSNMLPLP